MKVMHGDAHPGSINKMAVIDRHGLRREDIVYHGPWGHANIEVFAYIRGRGRVFTMRSLEWIAAHAKRPLEIIWRAYDRLTGEIRDLCKVTYSPRSAA